MDESTLLSILKHPQEAPPARTFRDLLEESESLFMSEPQLLRIDAEALLIVGDTHGDLISSVQAMRKAEDLGVDAILFLGDYVDRGPNQVENLAFLLAWRLMEPERLFLLRGNHESPVTNAHYGFLAEVTRKYGRDDYEGVSRAFSMMPYAAVSEGEVFGVHGGLAKGLEALEEVLSIPKGDVAPESPLAYQLLWNDPDEKIDWFSPNMRGPGIWRFGNEATSRFLERNRLRKIVRSHEFFREGIREMFGGKLSSVFSCRYYGGGSASILLKGRQEAKVLLE